MKKLLAILGSIGLTSTAASAVVACGNGGNANVGGNKSIVVNPDIANGSYDSDTKTFTAQYGSDKYQDHKMSFSLTKVVLKAENIHVVNAQGTNVDQGALWKFWTPKNSGNTVFEIEDSSLNGATVQIELANHLSVIFKIAIHQNLVVGNVTNGSYDANTTTFSADFPSAQYSDHKMSFSLANVSLSESNFNVTKSDGTKTAVKDGLWSFTVTDTTTTVHIDDYHLNQATIQINLDGYNSITFKIVINQSKEIAIDNTVANGSYSSDSKTFTAKYGSSVYQDHEMSFVLNEVSLTDANVVVTTSNNLITTTGWSLTNDGEENTKITINDYNLNKATIEIKDVEGYWPVTLKVVIPQDKDVFVNQDITNGKYDDAAKTFTAKYGSSKYDDNNLLFSLKDLVATEQKIVVKDVDGQVIEQASNRWSFWTSEDGASTVFEIKDSSMNGATISIQDVDGYWPVTFNITIIQDKHIMVEDVKNGDYNKTTKTFTAKYGNSTYQEEGHEMSFKIKGLALKGDDSILVRSNSDEEITTGWNATISGGDTIITIDDYNLNNTKVIVQNVDGYWNDTFNVVIPQDQVFIPNVTNGSYDANSETLTAAYGSSVYNDHDMSFALNGVTLSADNIVVKDSEGTIITNGWNFTTSDENTTITINDYNLNKATIEIKDVEGYWPVILKVVISQDKNVVVNTDVSNGSYDASSKTLTANYGGAEYDSHHMDFSIRDITLTEQNIVVRDSEGKVVELSSDSWFFWTSDDGVSTAFEIKNTSLNGATIEIKDVEGYWPVILKVVISQDQE